MMHISNESPTITSLKSQISRLKAEVPSVGKVLEAFEGLLLEEACFKETLTLPKIETGRRDVEHDIRAGIPLANRAEVKIPEEEFNRAVDALLPSLRRGLPSVGRELDGKDPFAGDTNQGTKIAIAAALAGKNDEIRRCSEVLNVEMDILRFVLERLIKPFAEMWGKAAGPLVSDTPWFKGYCPLCGSWPNLSFRRGTSGKRWLHCSFCGHEWAFMRSVCPFCENDDQQKLESIFTEDRPFEAVDVCLICKRYLLRKDLQEEVGDVFPEVVALGMIHLDALAQEHGFRPTAFHESPACPSN
jgi:FdhE protein